MTDQRDVSTGVDNGLAARIAEAADPTGADVEARDDVAIVGMVCELPGSAHDPQTFWRNLVEEHDTVTEIATSRPWLLDEFECFWGGKRENFPRFAALTDEPTAFDADFFAISPREAQAMDPQQRKGLEATWRVLESAGHPPSSLRGGQVGVFAGVYTIDYLDLAIERRHALLDRYGALGDTGVHSCLIANRISRWFDFHGPSETINTACSSSLVALSRAVSSVRSGESDVAVAVGVNLLLGARMFAGLDAANMLSPRGRCRTLDAGADGYVRAEGVVAVAVKPLSRAIADGDPVHAVIKAAVTNHDGRSSSLRAPNPEAQRRLVINAYQRAGVPVDTIGYVELHGTGTPLGDHVEVTALRKAFTDLDPGLPEGSCAIGSAKTNVGHLESGAGLVGVLKAVLSMRYRTLPGLLHFERLNPEIELGPFRVVTGTEPWEPRRDETGAPLPLRAGVNSFGYGGVNAHAIIEEYRPAHPPHGDERKEKPGEPGPVPVLLSARTKERLSAQADALLAHLRSYDVALADLAWTLATGRDHLEHRFAFVAASVEEAIERLRAFCEGEVRPDTVRGDARKIPAGVSVFADEPELRDMLLRWAVEGRYERVLELWAYGVDIPWRLALATIGGRVVDLPTYAFARTTHWLPEPPGLSGAPAAAPAPVAAAPAVSALSAPPAAATASPLADVHLYEETWRLGSEADGSTGSGGQRRDLGRTVVIAPGVAVRTDLRRRLTALGASPFFLVGPDEPVAAGKVRPDEHIVDLANVDSLAERLATTCSDTGLSTLLDLRAALTPAGAEDALAPLRLLSAIARSGLRPKVVVLAAAAIDDRQLALAESWLGFERSAGQVLPGTQVALSILDERAAAVPERLGRLLDDAMRARPHATLHEREGIWWRHLRPRERPAASPGVRRGGTFLITGGLGGLGLITARYLADSGAGTVVLTGRREPGEPARRAIGELEASGVRVITVCADASDEPGMRRALDDARAKAGPLHGVVHAAGVNPAEQLTEATEEQVRAVLRPKIDGTLLLERLTEHDPLDFFCMYSSVSAVLGDFGAATYSMGNAFQAAWAARRPRRLAIQWPLWESGGMSLTPSAAAMYQLAGLRAMRTEEGLALLDCLLSGNIAAPVVLTGDGARIAAQVRVTAPAAAPDLAPVSAPARLTAVSSASDGSGRDVVVGLVAEVLGVEPGELDLERPLVELGADSVMLSELAVALGDVLGVRVTPALFFDHPSVGALADHLVAVHGPRLDAISSGSDTGSPSAPAPAAAPDLAPVSAPARLTAVSSASDGSGRDVVVGLVAEVLGVEPGELDLERPLVELGADSVMLSELAVALGDVLGVRVTPALFFDHPSVGALADHLVAVHGPRLDAAASAAGASTASTASTTPAVSTSDLTSAPVVPVVPVAQPAVPAAQPHVIGRDDIAVVGLSVRSAAGRDLDALWSTLMDGTVLTRAATGDEPGRSDVAGFNAAYLDGVDEFDPLFFEIVPADAATIDPRQRLLMQETWHALEDAGIGPRQRRERRIATYVGAEDGYFPHLFDEPAIITANHTGVLASRIAYLLDMDGPAIVLNTACSSGLVAVHQARQALLAGDCDTALAAGVNVLVSRDHLQLVIDTGVTSPSGVCRPFDAAADGIVPGEAAVVLVLRRLADARRDGDRVLGIIRATGINYDGRTNGITAPNRRAQVDLIRQVHAEAGVSVADIGCVMSHGTGTLLGDPIEVDALVDVLGTAPPGSCALVSTKGAVGHTFAASGVLNLAVLLMALRTRMVPGTTGHRRASEYIEWDKTPFRVSADPLPWPGNTSGTGRPRIGVTSAFGITGTNAHVVVEEPPAELPREPLPGPYLLVLSGRDAAAVDRASRDLAAALARPGAPELDAVCHTLLERRDHRRHRRALVVSDTREAVVALGSGPGSAGAYDITAALPRIPPANTAEVEGLLAKARASAQCPELPVLKQLAHAYCAGHDISGDHLTGGRSLPVVSLPGYPFDRNSYWPSPRVVPNAGSSASAAVPAVTPTESNGNELVLGIPQKVPYLPRPTAGPGRRLVVLVRPGTPAVTAGTGGVDGIDVLELRWDRLSIPGLYADATVTLLGQLKEALAAYPDADMTVQLVVPETGRAAIAAGLHGLILSVCREQPRVWAQLIIVGDGAPGDLTGPLAEVAGERTTTRLTLSAGGWQRTAWTPVSGGVDAPIVPRRPGGVYLLTGAGGITRHLAPHLAALSPGATILLTARSAPGDRHDGVVRAVNAVGGRCVYERTDVTSRSDVHALVDRVLREHGRLDGVVHAAGVLDDAYLTRKDPEAARVVLAPKIDGAVHLDEATRDINLEFFVFCSSITGVLGNVGQTDYAAANGFLDGFAAERAGRIAAGTRRGTTVSIAWPLWRDGGMRVDEATETVLREATGQVPLPVPLALRAFDQAVALGHPHIAVLHGERARVTALLDDGRETPPQDVVVPAPTSAGQVPTADQGDAKLTDAVLARLTVLFAQVSGLAAAEVDPDESLGSYGLDSFLVTRLNHRLSPAFPRGSKTLFFEHQTLREVADALATTFSDDSRRWTAPAAGAAGVGTAVDVGTTDTNGRSGTVSTSDSPAAVPVAVPAFVPATSCEHAGPAPIAIIGMSGRFPGADNLDEFWTKLRAGYDAVTEIPPDRWSLDGFYEPDPDRAEREHKSYCKWGGFLLGHADFDPLFFGISPREAVDVDPQERLFLQECWRTVEDAGYSRRRLARVFGGRIGVYAGVTRAGYALLWGEEARRTGVRAMPQTNFSSIPNRVSYVLNLSGPSMPIDTMCSSSLTAVHEACEHLRRGECDAALVGGVNIYSHPAAYVEMSRRRMLSPSGRCRSFGYGGDGMVPGEGVAVVMLKPLDAARADGDRVLGVIAGSGINHGGRTSGYTVPNPRAQAELISTTLRRAGVTAREVSYVEAHGTGTTLGDPVELSGLNTVFRAGNVPAGACSLGSVKSNIGHLEAAAGIAGLAKIVLQLRYRELVPTLHADPPNPQLDLDGSPFHLQQEVRRWTAPGPLTAGLSAFGAGGVNAHVVVRAADDEYPISVRSAAA